MNELDRRRWEHSQRTLERAEGSARGNPELAASWYSSAYLLMTAVKLNENEEAEAVKLLSTYLKRVSPFYLDRSVPLSTTQQNDLLFIAGYTKNYELAKELVAVPVDSSKEHGFVKTINYLFRSWFGTQPDDQPAYSPDKCEVSLFNAFSSVTEGADLDQCAVESFWSATKNKRYKDTIWGKANIFSHSLRNYATAFNKASHRTSR
ncbi:hypothetical protein [Neptuniibacter caesariensis]|nr:hypothetical protein [Neptuniibacter caesariensis]